MYVGLNHPEVFRSVASISGSFVSLSFDKRFGPAPATGAARGFRFLWIGSGTEDLFSGGTKAFSARLDAAKMPHTFRQRPGAHTMPVARVAGGIVTSAVPLKANLPLPCHTCGVMAVAAVWCVSPSTCGKCSADDPFV
jgi:hypothetical protein